MSGSNSDPSTMLKTEIDGIANTKTEIKENVEQTVNEYTAELNDKVDSISVLNKKGELRGDSGAELTSLGRTLMGYITQLREFLSSFLTTSKPIDEQLAELKSILSQVDTELGQLNSNTAFTRSRSQFSRNVQSRKIPLTDDKLTLIREDDNAALNVYTYLGSFTSLLKLIQTGQIACGEDNDGYFRHLLQSIKDVVRSNQDKNKLKQQIKDLALETIRARRITTNFRSPQQNLSYLMVFQRILIALSDFIVRSGCIKNEELKNTFLLYINPENGHIQYDWNNQGSGPLPRNLETVSELFAPEKEEPNESSPFGSGYSAAREAGAFGGLSSAADVVPRPPRGPLSGPFRTLSSSMNAKRNKEDEALKKELFDTLSFISNSISQSAGSGIGAAAGGIRYAAGGIRDAAIKLGTLAKSVGGSIQAKLLALSSTILSYLNNTGGVLTAQHIDDIEKQLRELENPVIKGGYRKTQHRKTQHRKHKKTRKNIRKYKKRVTRNQKRR